MKQLGIKSGIANFSLIISTLIVGAISNKDWHLPFIVYLTPIIPLLLSPFLTRKHLRYSQQAELETKKSCEARQQKLEAPLLSEIQIKKESGR
jgi:hypothetical protein